MLVILYVEIARLYGTLGYQRKAAFFLRQVAQLYMQQENRLAAISAMQVLATTTTKTYRVQSRASMSKNSNDIITSHADSGKTHNQTMVVLREILLLSAVRAGSDPLAAWSAAARLLRSYYPLITPAGAKRLPSGIRCADAALPFIRLHSFPIHPLQVDLIKRNPARDDWWAGRYKSMNDNSKQEMLCVVWEPAQGLVLSDPFRCCGNPKLKNLEAVISVSHETLQSVLPLKPGAEVTIPVTIKAWQLGLTEHEIAGSKKASGSMGRHPKDNSSPPYKIDPNRGSWGLRFLELELSNPTDVGFEISVSFELENSSNPSTFGFLLSQNASKDENGDSDTHNVSSSSTSPVVAHDMTHNLINNKIATVLRDGVLNEITMEVPSLQETIHRFTLYFLVPGEYTLVAAALIEDANEILRSRAKTTSPDEPIFCRGPPFRVRVMGTS
uniref:Uncharacterized protein n=1 Tax=Kalanchoe fedtschenkoi TaxID=63787 RepID=A0A7N0TA99_KALFE